MDIHRLKTGLHNQYKRGNSCLLMQMLSHPIATHATHEVTINSVCHAKKCSVQSSVAWAADVSKSNGKSDWWFLKTIISLKSNKGFNVVFYIYDLLGLWHSTRAETFTKSVVVHWKSVCLQNDRSRLRIPTSRSKTDATLYRQHTSLSLSTKLKVQSATNNPPTSRQSEKRQHTSLSLFLPFFAQ